MLEWNLHLETGHPGIDEEHRQIYAQLNAIGVEIGRGADHEALRRLIRTLLDYVSRHFRNEEHVMTCTLCPAREKNCAAHRAFVARVHNWLALFRTGVVPASLIADIHAECCAWIERHIARVDIELRATPAATRDAAA